MADPKHLLDAHVVQPMMRKKGPRYDRRLSITLVQWNAKGLERRCQAKGTSWCASARVDGHEVARTQPLEELKPYWDQSFQVVIPEDLSLVSVYLHEITKAADVPIAKVDIPKQKLQEKTMIDDWFPLRATSEETDITGRINVDVEIEQHPAGQWNAKVVVVEGAGFSHTGLFVRVTLEQNAVSGESFHLPETAHINAETVRRSKVFRREMDPMWCESFDFRSPTALVTTKLVDGKLQWARGISPVVRLSAWREDADGKTVFCGATVIPITEKHLVKFEFSELALLEPQQYKPLEDMLMQCLECDDIMQSPVGLLSNAIRNKELLARHLLHFYLNKQHAFTFIAKLVDSEVAACKESPTLFRGNTLTTKVIDTYMKLFGKELLIVSLGPVVLAKVIRQHLELEINPAVLSNPVKLKENATQLEELVDEVVRLLLDNVAYCPPNLQHVFHYIAQAATERFTGVRRTLVLISKAIQTLGNLGGDRMVKEDFMRDLLSNVDAAHRNRIRIFLDKISCKPSTSPNAVPPAYAAVDIPDDDRVIKEGFLIKRGQGRKVASVMGMSVNGLKNMKRRYFRLSPVYLSYHKSQDEPAIDRIAKSDIIGVERVDADVLGYPHAFQIMRHDAILYLVAESAFELQEWLTTLKEFCSSNRNLASAYHPGVLTSKNIWSCCRASADTGGCHPCVKVQSSKYPRVKKGLWEDPLTCQEQIYQFMNTSLEKAKEEPDVLPEAQREAAAVCTALATAHQQKQRPKSRPGSKYNPIGF
ncbi:hypothetical protein PTSG_07380 [Salpingoeca rosetta]|uniref:Uncharacterized protein n=1 Tax=Salpingoeca rosetta (strain ATCC 50818 / BSB-021) TaxID=946362 RepID=F2UIJ0_SALR5|nr:uncharacterized protein PTSG_07380 [Salpingoeca rosetta]EGD77039.1 hypothetical protein PTSG_07380 [Salpingoeca rosetta]|eukprot:XP_004990879.1 hypothetical protein PTSG_07380 [Salpingoeca rosetta]